MTRKFLLYAAAAVMAALVCSCAGQRKLRAIYANRTGTDISLPEETALKQNAAETVPQRDTIQVLDMDGREMFLMNTVQDENGESIANEVLEAAIVTARFRHMAERSGKVDLDFRISIPDTLQYRKWQLRYQPTMFILDDSLSMDRLFVTGSGYRKKQQGEYRHYLKCLGRISKDSTRFVNENGLYSYIEDRIPHVYALDAADTVFVADREFLSPLGRTERMAVDRYTRKGFIRHHGKVVERNDASFNQFADGYVLKDRMRLDTVTMAAGNLTYDYIQELDVKGMHKLRKVDIVLDGGIYNKRRKRLYDIPRTEPLTFYISSLSSFVDGKERYLTKVIERKAEANASYNIEFETGKFRIDEGFRNNFEELYRIRQKLLSLLENRTYDLDSVVVVASASPEGPLKSNATLAEKRSESITRYFTAYMDQKVDSLNLEEGFTIGLAGDVTYGEKHQPITFKSRYMPENWTGLDDLIINDETMSVSQKDRYWHIRDISNLDERERLMKKESWYKHVKDELYPDLRSVNFKFALHRKGMVKDTVQTTVIDSTYLDGVQALRDHDYELAVALLAPYNDYNTAIAYCALDRNNSALAILEKCERTAQVNYMLAVVYSRFGEDQKAVQCYLNSCKQEPSFVHRGNLDPEISALIKKYNLAEVEGLY